MNYFHFSTFTRIPRCEPCIIFKTESFKAKQSLYSEIGNATLSVHCEQQLAFKVRPHCRNFYCSLVNVFVLCILLYVETQKDTGKQLKNYWLLFYKIKNCHSSLKENYFKTWTLKEVDNYNTRISLGFKNHNVVHKM